MLRLLLGFVCDLFRSRASLESEVVALRQQIVLLKQRLGNRRALSQMLIEVQASLLPPRYLRGNSESFTPDREGLVSMFSVFSSCSEMTVGIEGIVRRRM